MEKKLSGFNTISVLSVSLLIYVSGSLIAPALSSLAASFPETPFPTIRMIMTSMYITIAVFALISGRLSKYISKKVLVLIGLAIYGICGIIGSNLTTVSALMIDRLVMGVGVGLVFPQANALIIDFYEGKKRDKLLGYGSGISNLGSMLGSIVGGSLAAMGWKYNFLGFAVAFVIFILVLIGVPNTPVQKNANAAGGAAKEKLPGSFWFLPLYLCIVQLVALVTPTNMSVFYLKNAIGSPALLGLTMALLTGLGFLAGFVLTGTTKLLKSWTVTVSCLMIGAGFFCLAKSTNVGMVMIAQILIGFGQGTLTPMCFIKNTQLVPPSQRQTSLAILSSAIYLGCFGTSYVQKWIGQIFGNMDQRFMFMAFAVGGFIATAIALIAKFAKKEKC